MFVVAGQTRLDNIEKRHSYSVFHILGALMFWAFLFPADLLPDLYHIYLNFQGCLPLRTSFLQAGLDYY